MGYLSGRPQTKTVLTKEWNSLVRDLNRAERMIDRIVDEVSSLEEQIKVLQSTFIIPRGKKLGS